MTEETQDIPATDAPETDSSPENVTPEVTKTPDNAGISEKPDKDVIQKRIDTLTWEKHERAREAEYWRKRAEELEKPKEPEKPAQLPKLSDYEYDEAKFQAAMVEFTRAEARREATEVLRAERQREQEQNTVKTFRQRESDFEATTPDYRERVYDPSVPLSEEMARQIASSDNGPELAYYLATNKDKAAQLYSASPVDVAREIGRIEARLEAQRQAKEKPKEQPKVSAAPPPPPKIEAEEPAIKISPDEPDSDKLSDVEWMRKRNKQEKARTAQKAVR